MSTRRTKIEDDPAFTETPPERAAEPKPSIGRIVLYSLTEAQSAYADAQAGRKNVLEAGMACPAIVTDVHGDDCVDLRVIIRGQDAFVSSAMKGDEPGMWRWPARV